MGTGWSAALQNPRRRSKPRSIPESTDTNPPRTRVRPDRSIRRVSGEHRPEPEPRQNRVEDERPADPPQRLVREDARLV